MKKTYSNKMVDSDKEKVKRLKVLRECEVPRIGAWKQGDFITDPCIIKRVKDNPNFKPVKEGDK